MTVTQIAAQPAFVAATDPVQARSDREFECLVNNDLRDKYAAGPAYAVLSRPENLVRWLHTLVGISESIKTQTAHDKAALHTHPDKPIGGGPTPQSYADAKQKMQERKRSRDRTMQAVIGRIREVQRLIGPDPVAQVALGAVVGDLVTVRQCICNGDAPAAVQLITNLICTLTSEDEGVSS